jgi:hypothetical protein
MIITKEMREHFQKRMKTHIDRVNYFAKKLTLSFPEHDADKFLPENVDIQTKFSWSCFINRSLDGKEAEELDRVTLIHITTQQHHPEYWVDDKSLLEGFTRHIPTMGLDCSKMSNVAIYEMCCDWCAMAKQFHSHPKNWADKTVNKRWMFTDEQVTLIYDTLKFLSNGEEY